MQFKSVCCIDPQIVCDWSLQGIEHGSIASRPTLFFGASLSLRSLGVFCLCDAIAAFTPCILCSALLCAHQLFCVMLSLHPFILSWLFLVKPEADSILLTVRFVDGGLASTLPRCLISVNWPCVAAQFFQTTTSYSGLLFQPSNYDSDCISGSEVLHECVYA